ncbi:hypothetical protein KCU65_g5744, partial [Aureobasidium melanogenum]
MALSDNHDLSPLSSQSSTMNSKLSTGQRRDAMLDVLRAIEQQRYNFECTHTARECRHRSEAHKLMWHHDPYPPQLDPSPLLTRIGTLPELINNVLSHLDNDDLYRCVRVNKTWAKEAKRFIWHSADVKHLLSTSIPDERVPKYAALVRHLNWQACASMHLESDFWGYGPGFSTTRPIPSLPRITSLDCESSSLCEQTVEQLSTIFVPTLTQLMVRDGAASRWDDDILLLPELWGVSWFDVMAQNCPVLTSITLGSGLWIDTLTFHRFVKNAKHLTSVSLGAGNEHLLVNALAPCLKSAKVTIDADWEEYAIILRQLSKMHALEHLELTVWDVLLTGSTIIKFKALSKLKSLKVYTRGSYALAGCTATAGRLAEMLEAMPLLNEFQMAIPCEFMEGQRELLGDFWEVGTYFEQHSCRQQYLNYLHELAEEDHANAVAVSGTT